MIMKFNREESNTININYIVVMYIGKRGISNPGELGYLQYEEKFKTDPLFFAKIHRDFLSTCVDGKITKATFVFNDDISDDIKNSALNEIKLSNMNYEVIFRKNNGFSYGAWNDIIMKNLNDHDYFFMIEDDCIPLETDFYEYFIECCTLETPIVATYVSPNPPIHAASSNSIVRADVCREILDKTGKLFFVNNSNSLSDAWNTQTYFFKYFTENGYKMRDILDKYSTPHLLDCNINKIVTFGNPEFPHCIVPIVIPLLAQEKQFTYRT